MFHFLASTLQIGSLQEEAVFRHTIWGLQGARSPCLRGPPQHPKQRTIYPTCFWGQILAWTSAVPKKETIYLKF